MTGDMVRFKNTYIAERIKLPENVLGYLDWITGTLRLNLTNAQYNELTGESDDALWATYWEVYVHEMFHLFQVTSSGFLYNYATELSNDLLIHELELEANHLIRSANEFQPSEGFIRKAAKLNQPVKSGLSVVDIVESAAFLAHHIILNKVSSHEGYSSVLRSYKGSVYEKAYSFLSEKVGEKAFSMLCGVSYLSLSFNKPVEVFHMLSDQLPNHLDRIGLIPSHEILLDVIDEIFYEEGGEYGLLESPLSVAKQGGKAEFNPFYSHIIERLASHDDIEEMGNFMCNPDWITADIFLYSMRPVLLNDATMVVPKDFSKGMFDTKNQHEDMLKAVAVSAYQVMSCDDVGPHFLGADLS